ncbi:E3 ubiquitin-protein ligase TRIM21-like [Parambassis ranga]|uniref:E3 ubiquitin-protein ligase TRIM21-like n=1 Tax=Parambassis ranga TaxID=210632 RepID=A0A6P7JPM6_9TELE|nr:E3 ubiquitin-protein ligase TRIM21-like [Parambassis ranga]XP_028278869.1 E3 ubiquitin-protein ligase TRIM21-like [Parambassis ranga]
MATASTLLSEDQFLCSICLDVFTDPVTITCGHNYCKSCITQHWDVSVQNQCPVCKKSFYTRPELHVNTFISEMASEFRQNLKKRDSKQEGAKEGDVPCDVCTETKVKAVKSCLVCLTSYCQTHLEPHHRITGLKRHQLINAVKNLEDRVCKKHDRPLELFCKTHQVCVCQFCTELDHRGHVIIPLKEEYEGKKAELKKTESDIQQMIQERRVKMEQIKESVKLSKEDADRETAASVQVFTALIQSVERGLAQLTDMIEEKQKTREKQAEGFIKELEEEISELMKRSSEVEQLSHTEDHLHLLQSYSSLNPAPPTKDWTEVTVHSSYMGTVRRAVALLEEPLIQEMKKLCNHVELKRVQQYAVDVTFDPETAHPKLILSDEERQVYFSKTRQNVPENPKRFTYYPNVLGKQGFSSGRFYYEVQVTGNTEWDLGVARGAVYRKGKNPLSPKNGFWTIWLRNGKDYTANASPPVRLSLMSKPQKVGVFVDYEEGVVSFYDVDAAALIYSFTDCNFTETLLPFFSPSVDVGQANPAPLIICPVHNKH